MPFADLRQFLTHLEASGQLLRIREPVDPQFEIAAYIRKTSDTGGPALYFESVKGSAMPVVGGLFATRRLALEAMGTDEADAIAAFLAAIERVSAPRLIAQGACQEVVKRGTEADLTELPVVTHCDLDGGPFITCAVALSRDAEDGTRNASIYRFQVNGKRRLAVLAEPPHHLGIHIARARERQEPLEIALAIGLTPAVLLATQWEAPYGVDELELAGGLLGEPLEVVKGVSVDLNVPAHAELIIEGRVLPDVQEMEGPFGEYTGYYTPAYPKPVMEVTAITHRHDMIYQDMLTGEPTTENHVLKMIPAEASCYAMLKSRFPGVVKVHFHGAGGVGLLGIVAMEPQAPREARSVLTTLLGAQGTKIAIAVDSDVNVFDVDHVMWAVSTRCQPHRDVIVMPPMLGRQLDPSAEGFGQYGLMGIDATMPHGQEFDQVARVPGVEKVPDLLALASKATSSAK